MNRCRITWPDGSSESGPTDLSEEGYINERFGSAYPGFLERGGALTVAPEFVPEVPPPRPGENVIVGEPEQLPPELQPQP